MLIKECACVRAQEFDLCSVLTLALVKKLKCKGMLTLCGPNSSREFQQSGHSSFSRKSLIFKVQRQPLDNRSLRKTMVKDSKVTCPFKFDIGPYTAEITVELN